MGICVDITLTDVKFLKSNQTKMLKALSKEFKIPKYDSFEEILESFGFPLNEDEIHGYIEECWSEKLHDQEKVLRTLAPYLFDCEIKFVCEDDSAWKFKIIDGVAQESEYREEF